MGEVYRACDSTLKREVALKVLPEELSRDAERNQRFEREATLLASLNHPNVATVYGFEREGDSPFLIMELVEGETVAERLERGPIPWPEARDLAHQAAVGLEAAHRAGVVHRDLKPANLKIDPEGRLKILDFGLAKDMQHSASSSLDSATQSPTLTQATSPGVLLGAASYMSPEQARGSMVDEGTDIWSLGCVLWEMLSGARPFRGDSVTDILAEILKSEPDPSELPDMPRSLRRSLDRCLGKRRRDRYQHVGDLRLDLEEGEEEPGSPLREVAVPSKRGGWALPVLAAAAVASFALGWWLRPSGTDPTTNRPTVLRSFQVTAAPGAALFPAISPVGQFVAYSKRTFKADGVTGEIYLQRLGGTLAINLTAALEGDFHKPSFSPDGSEIAFQNGLGIGRDRRGGIFLAGFRLRAGLVSGR